MPTPDSRRKPGDTRTAPGSPPFQGSGQTGIQPHGDVIPAATPQSQRLPHNNLVLPRSPLIGREHDAAAVQTLLLQDTVALLTLTGPGGIGKTRLALQVAANLLDHFIDGVYFVSLAPIRDPQQVCAAIAQTLGVQEAAGRPLMGSLHDYLRDKQLLLVADNFEQVTAAAPLVAELLLHCRQLKVLATSRTKLHLYGEHEYRVPPLALPKLDVPASVEAAKLPDSRAKIDVKTLAAAAAVALFAQRAVEVEPDFVLSAANAMVVAAICINLEGLPLAIELAAAKLNMFSPPALLARLKQGLALLTGGPQDAPARQRTLRDEIAWSYDLLAPGEQVLFRRLAIFAGSFTLEAALAVGDAAGNLGIAVVDGVATLLDQQLLKRNDQSDGEPRFRMLETIREFGLEQLAISGETEAAQRQHAFYYVKLAESIGPSFVSDDKGARLESLLADLANVRSALAWSQQEGERADMAATLASGLLEFWLITGLWSEGRRWSEGALAMTTAGARTVARARLLVDSGMMAVMQNDPRAAQERLAEGLALARGLDLPQYVRRANTGLGWMADGQHDYERALDHLREALAIHRAAGNKVEAAGSLVHIAGVRRAQHEYAGAQTLLEEAKAIFEEAGAAWEVADVLHYMGQGAQRQGEYARAWALFQESLARWRAIGTLLWKGIPECLEGLAEICVDQWQFTTAAHLFGATEALYGGLGAAPQPFLPSSAKTKFAALKTDLDESAFVAAWADGRDFTPEQAVEYALALPDLSTAAPAFVLPRPPANPGGLTAREVEVLRLLVEGLTYAQIAEKLFVSRRTVNAHVTSIYSKLGVNNRVDAMRFAAGHKLT